MHGGKLWRRHPGVRTGEQLTAGERAADKLKAWFGSWGFLLGLNAVIIGWVAANVLLPLSSRWDVYPYILLNLGLSWLAAQQGGALQIASNRGDRISAEVALHTQSNTERLIAVNDRQLEILTELRQLRDRLGGDPPPGNGGSA